MPWPTTPEALLEEQRLLSERTPPAWRFDREVLIGGCFVCFAEDPEALAAGAEPAWAAAVTFEAGRRVAASLVEGATPARYEPGLLALRAGPLLAAAVASLSPAPDVLLVNATGRDHPRRAGLALHLGAVLDLPTVGVTDRPLLATTGAPVDAPEVPAEAGSLRLDGVDVGALVQVGPGSRGVWVHAAWRTDVATAKAVVGSVTGPARTPVPLREARRIARSARAAAQGAAPTPAGDPRPQRSGNAPGSEGTFHAP